MNNVKFARIPPIDRMILVETFVCIIDAGSLSAAARLLDTTQPTISRRLKLLERSLGVRLLHRSTHAMKLTEDGERCYTKAKELIEGWQAFESEVRGSNDEPTGTLRVVMPHAFGQQQLIEPLGTYLKRYPRTNVEWLLHDRMPDFIAEGIDCAVRVGDIDDDSVIAVLLGEVPRIPVAAPEILNRVAIPRRPEQLASMPWVALKTFYLKEVVLNHHATGEIVRFPIQPRLSTDSLYALRSAAQIGIGVAIGSTWLLQEDIASGKLLHLVPEWQAAPLPIYLVYPRARFYPAKLRRFIELMRIAVPESIGNVVQTLAPSRRA